jgi:alpha-beta hydrolase superfamily lysophospholipase
LKEVLAGLAAASGVGYLAAAYTVSRWLTRSSRGRPCPAPDRLGLAFEEAACVTADGYRLKGWVVEPPAARGTVALFHGIRANRTQTLDRIAFLAPAGYRCLAFDHRAHGQSSGRCTSFGFRESGDVTAVLSLARQRWPQQPVAAFGISMGAAALCFAAGQHRGLDAVILESLYHDLDSTFRNRIGSKFPSWFRRFRRGVVWVTERRLRLRLQQIAPVEYVGRLAPTPVLLLTGSEDAAAPPEDAERLFVRCKEPRRLVLVPGADHYTMVATGGQFYRDTILDFLDCTLRSASRAA